MRWNSFGRSTVFAVLGAIAAGAWLLAAGPLLGVRRALTLYLVGLAATYVAGLGSSRRRALGAAVATAVVGCGFGLVTGTLGELALGLAVVLALARSAFLYRRPPARAVAIEAVLVIGGLLFARFLAGTSMLSVMLALWGFLLVQSVFFLIGGVWVRASESTCRDPFDAAYTRALALLDLEDL